MDTIKDTMYSPEPGQLFKLVSILKLLSGVRLLSLALCTNRKWSHLTLWKAVLNAKYQNILQNVFQRSDHQETIAFPCLIQTLYFDVSLFKKMFNVKVALWLNRQCQTWVVWLGVGGLLPLLHLKAYKYFCSVLFFFTKIYSWSTSFKANEEKGSKCWRMFYLWLQFALCL